MEEGFYKAREELKKKSQIELDLKDISKIQYKLLDQENLSELYKRGALYIVESGTYNDTMSGLHDPMMGSIRKDITCARCGNDMWKCTGHFGYIKLAREIVNPEHLSHVAKILDLFSEITYEKEGNDFYKLIPTDDMIDMFKNLSYFKKLTSIHKKTQKKREHKVVGFDIYIKTSSKKGEKGILLHPEAIKDILSKLHNKDLEKIGICGIRPENFVMRFIPILPVAMRPYNTITGQLKADDLTVLYSQILKFNNDFINSTDKNKTMDKVIDAYQKLMTTGGTCRQGMASKSIKTVMNGKEGLIRQSTLGKRINFCARAVASPDPFMPIDEIGVPFYYAKILTVQMICVDNPSFSNIDKCREYIMKNKIDRIVDNKKGSQYMITPENKDRMLAMLKPGIILSRYLENGDVIVLHRYPTLHKHSMFSAKVKFMPGKTIRINPAVAEGLNEDYDGDENNVTIPQSYIVQASVQEIMNIKNCIISEKKSIPIVGLTQDFVIGALKLSLDTTDLGKGKFQDMIFMIGKENKLKDLIMRCEKHNIYEYSGKALISSLFPKDMKFNVKLDMNEIFIIDGIFVKGVLSKSVLSSGSNSIVQHLYKYYNENIAADFIHKMSIISIQYLTQIGFSIGYSDCIVDANMNKKIKDTINRSIEEVKQIKEVDDPVLKIKREVQITSRLNAVRDVVGRILVEGKKNKKIPIPINVSSIHISYVGRYSGNEIFNTTTIKAEKEESKYLKFMFSEKEHPDFILSNIGLTVVDDIIILKPEWKLRITIQEKDKLNTKTYSKYNNDIRFELEEIIEILPYNFTDDKDRKTFSVGIISQADINIVNNGNLYLSDIHNIDIINVDFVNKKLYVEKKNGNIIELESKGAKTITIETGNFKLVESLIEEENPFRTMVDYGAKGTPMNMIQLSGLIGQQLSGSNRLPLEMTNETRVLPHFDVNDNDPVARGFCASSYVEGLTPTEQYMHFILTREGLTDSTTKTSDTGYTYRKLSHFMENLRSEHDGSIRDNNGNIVQFLYGGNGYDTSMMVNVKGKLTFANVDVLISKIKIEHKNILYLYKCKNEEDCKKLLYIIPILLSEKPKLDYDIIVFVKEKLFKYWYSKLKTSIVDVLPGYPSNTEIEEFQDEYEEIYLYKF